MAKTKEAPAFNLAGLTEPEVYIPSGEPVEDAIVEFVEDSYEYWLDHQDRWRTVSLDDPESMAYTVAEARRYCTAVRDEPLTFQVKGYEEGDTSLTYRAREAVRRPRKNGSE